MYALVELLIHAACLGLAGFLEHPAFAVWQAKRRPATIWAWPVIRWMTQLSCVQITTFDQCTMGACARKPTTILSLRLPMLRTLLMARGESGRCSHTNGHAPLIGKSKDGQWRTGKAKIYPVQLNVAIAESVLAYLKVATGALLYTQRPEFLDAEPAQEFVPEDIVQRDYHG